MIACQTAGGQIRLTQEEMATVLDVARAKINEALQKVMSHGIVFKVRCGVYQFNRPYSYLVAELISGTELVETEYLQVDQDKMIPRIRRDESLPDLVRLPSLEHMREAIEELRKSGSKNALRGDRPVRSARRRDQPSEYFEVVGDHRRRPSRRPGPAARRLEGATQAARAQRAGGRTAMDQATLGELLGLNYPSVNAAMRELELELAKLVKNARKGIYRTNPMLPGYTSPEGTDDAVRAMPTADRLDGKEYLASYHKALSAYQDQLAEQRNKRAALAAAKKAATDKRRGSLHAVG